MTLLDQANADGIQFEALTFDEAYGRDGHFLDGLDQRNQAFVGEVPPQFKMWLYRPRKRSEPQKRKPGRPFGKRRLVKRDQHPSQVQNLCRYSPSFRDQGSQLYRVRDSHKGPEIWEVRWHVGYRRTHTDRLFSTQCTLLVATHVLTKETKYFVSNRVPGKSGWSVRKLLRVAFSRWKVEACFREVKEELGWDHFECRGWQCIHRHLAVTIVAQLFCARVRASLSPSDNITSGRRLTLEQVRRAADTYLRSVGMPRQIKLAQYQAELDRIDYHQRRNAYASRSHTSMRDIRYQLLGIDPERIKWVEPKHPPDNKVALSS